MRMVEQMARAICKNSGHVSDRHWKHYTKAASAALQVLRDPDGEMVVAGDDQIIEAINDHSFALREKTPAEACFRAMIDKAIQESRE